MYTSLLDTDKMMNTLQGAKLPKLRKLVTKATELETRMQRHHIEAHDSSYKNLLLHVIFGARKWQW